MLQALRHVPSEDGLSNSAADGRMDGLIEELGCTFDAVRFLCDAIGRRVIFILHPCRRAHR